MAGGDDRRRHRDELGTADLAEHLERIGDAGDPIDGLAHGDLLAHERGVVDAGAAADPCRDLAAAERGGHRGGRRRVPDAHLAEHQQVGVEPLHGVAAGA